MTTLATEPKTESKTDVLLGDEAIALAAIHAGISGAFSYPGTPATEILETIEKRAKRDSAGDVHACWAANEKVAYEEALGMSYAGKRSIVSMKHVGLNVAADPFMNSALTGAHGGLVVVVADDPSMHSSQNEQDTRYYGEFAQLPFYEPANQQEAYDITLEAFEESERLGLPVLIRVVTRLAHSRANVQVRSEGIKPPALGRYKNAIDWTLIPSNARRRNVRLTGMNAQLVEEAEASPYNMLALKGKTGVIASGIATNYVYENLGEDHDVSMLKIARYPIPTKLVKQLVGHCDEVLVVEDGYPFIESRLNGVLGLEGKKIKGRLTGDLPRTGELNPDNVRVGLGLAALPTPEPVDELAGRPPQLCKGCPHADFYNALTEALKEYDNSIVFSDIGCYTLGVLPPYSAIESCVDMGASIGMARGASLAGVHPSCCVIGDSTFAHSGLTPLVGAARSNSNMTVFILDNSTVAMTGAQQTMASGDEVVDLVKGVGVDAERIRIMNPLPRYHEENIKLIQEEVEREGLSVVIARRPCIQI